MKKDHYPSFVVSDIYNKQLMCEEDATVEEEREPSPNYGNWKNGECDPTKRPKHQLKPENNQSYRHTMYKRV